MSDNGIMPIAIQRKGLPETQTLFISAMHFDLSHLVACGYEFPRVRIAAGQFGAYIDGPLRPAAGAS